jgi:2-phosphoglycolate phosphatase
MRPISLLIFDLDGTLVNTLEDIAGSVNHTLGRFGYGPLAPDLVRQYVGDGIETLMERSLGGRTGRLDEAVAIYKEHHRRNLVVRSALYPGVRETLDHFKFLPMAVVSNKSREFIHPLLDRLGISTYFSMVIGADSGPLPKPAPGALLGIMAAQGVAPGRTVMVGDGTTDVLAGKAAGVITCAVTYGFRSEEELRKAGPDLIIHRIGELTDLFAPEVPSLQSAHDMTYPIQNIKPERLSIILKVGMRLAAERNLDRLLAMIIDETTAVMDAERSSLFLIDAQKGEMWAKIAQGVDVVEIRFPVGVGIAGTVGKTGEIINIPDAYHDARFNAAFDKKTGFRTRSILCVPLRNIVGDTIGAIQVLNKRSGLFDQDDEALLTALAAQASVAIDNADLYRKLSELNLSLENKVKERTSDLVRANERLSALNKELEEISIKDGLTQAFNRQYCMDRIKQEVKRASRYGTHVSLLMFDIDHFKRINDTYGHQAGDTVLASFAALIQDGLRETDLFARYGGEEFSLIAMAMDLAEAQLFAERVRQKVEAAEFMHGALRLKVTVSIGVSTWQPEIREDFDELIRRADEALYRAKEQGRNRVCSVETGSPGRIL